MEQELNHVTCEWVKKQMEEKRVRPVDVAKHYSVHHQTVYQYISSSPIPIGKKWKKRFVEYFNQLS
ncbi:hypothetical protein [Pleomorphovibrio marinus]|uniref:hypothetical protein n=1 Tax=Pleomorphovibrio marinus TaxID=2164132 RepID=UPI000E0A43B3|nr:hypothetical protein [Pleomorphovibrio marinus]